MAKASRCQNKDIINTGHGCDSTAPIQGCLQSTVFINKILGAVKGDPIAPHTILSGPSCIPHNAIVNEGSSNVFYEGIPAARVGHSADQGSIITGSDNVFVDP